MPDHGSVVEAQRRYELRALLRAARDRLIPAEVGLGPGGRRGCPGLRRSEVAALAGISEVWYTRFETGQRRVSPRVIERLCDVLRLNRPECDRLTRLALPELDTFRTALHESPGLSIVALNSELRRIAAASSIEELCESALRLASSEITGDLFFADRAELNGSRGVAMRGLGAAAYEGRLEPWHSDVVQWQTTSRGLFLCSDLAALGASDTKESQEYAAGYRSFAGAVIQDSFGLRGAFGVVRRSVSTFADFEITTLDTISQILSLVLMPVAGGSTKVH